MTREQREQAAEVLEKFQNGTYGHGGKVGVVIDTAIAALRQPGWVKTADRVPTWEDAPHGYVANAWSYDENPHREDFTITGAHIRQIEKTDNPNDFWFALPPLPENAGLEGTKING